MVDSLVMWCFSGVKGQVFPVAWMGPYPQKIFTSDLVSLHIKYYLYTKYTKYTKYTNNTGRW